MNDYEKRIVVMGFLLLLLFVEKIENWRDNTTPFGSFVSMLDFIDSTKFAILW